jgi:hypothetical protein
VPGPTCVNATLSSCLSINRLLIGLQRPNRKISTLGLFLKPIPWHLPAKLFRPTISFVKHNEKPGKMANLGAGYQNVEVFHLMRNFPYHPVQMERPDA